MQLGRYLLAAVAGVAAMATTCDAAVWSIDQASASPGESISVPLYLSGDGATSAAQVTLHFDPAILQLPVASGEIPGAGRNGAHCVRASSHSVTVFFVSGRPVPDERMEMCVLPFTISTAVRNGSAQFGITDAWCLRADGEPQPCTLDAGAVTVVDDGPPRPGDWPYIPVISPNPVMQGVPATLTTTVNICRHGSGGHQLSRNGSVIEVQLTMGPPPHICPPILVVLAPLPITLPALPAGEYTVRFVFRDLALPQDNPPVLLGLTVLAPRVVPVAGWGVHFLMALLLLATGLGHARRQR
jgi:hypothetical protein